MTASRNRSLAARLVSFAACVIVSGVSAAYAEVGPPVRLGPPDDTTQAPSPPDQSQPADIGGQLNPPDATPAPTDATPAPTPSGQSRVPLGISANELTAPEPDAIGVLSAQDHAFPLNLWQGSSKSFVFALLPKIGTTSSPTVSNLALRLLGSEVTPPEGDGPAGILLAMRAERLTNALGRADIAYGLLAGVPMSDQSEALTQISADLAFLSGNTAAACALIAGHSTSWQSAYWGTGTTACDALNGRADDARLGLDIMRDAKIKDDGFSAVVEIAVGDGAKLPDILPSPQPMALALLAKAGSPLPKHTLDTANLAIIRAIAIGSGFPSDQRLDAAERAATFGALAPEKLAEAYLASSFTQEDRDSPLNRALNVGGSYGRAILFNAARDARSPIAKANFLVTLVDKVAKSDLYFAVVRACEALILEVPVTPDLSSAAPSLARALYALDHPREAAAWLAIASPLDAGTLLPLAHIVDDKTAPPWNGADLADLLRGDGKDAGLAARKAVLAGQLLGALGTPLPEGELTPLLDAKASGPAAVSPGAALDNEIAANHLGGTVLAGLAALGDQGAAANGATLAQFIRGLRTVGLDDDARHLAIDAAITAGF